MRCKNGYPPWVKAILEKITVTIYRGKSEQVLNGKENIPICNLESKLLRPGHSRDEQKVFVIGFEDEEDIWNDCSDIVVKTYELGEPGKYRVEIFCSGVNRKVIRFDNKVVLNYQGYNEEDIKSGKQIIGTVIFDVQIS